MAPRDRATRLLLRFEGFFLSIPRPPPTFPLFPYTTLFRSRRLVLVAARARHPRDARLHVQHRDRKSTRLNSSHLGISYAVFCLKKKTDGKTPEISRTITFYWT